MRRGRGECPRRVEDSSLVQVPQHRGQAADRAGQPVDAIDEKDVVPLQAGIREGPLQTGTARVGPDMLFGAAPSGCTRRVTTMTTRRPADRPPRGAIQPDPARGDPPDGAGQAGHDEEGRMNATVQVRWLTKRHPSVTAIDGGTMPQALSQFCSPVLMTS